MHKGQAFGRLLAVELKLFFREPVAVFFSVVFPILLLLIFGSIFGDESASPGYRVIDEFVPALVAVIAAQLALAGIPIVFADYRETGVFRRFKVSPLPLSIVGAVQIAVGLVMFVGATVLLILLAAGLFSLRFGGTVPAVLGVSLMGATAMFALGLAVASVATTMRTAQATGSALFFTMLFLSGAALPRDEFPGWLRTVSELVPLTHFVDPLTTAWRGARFGASEWTSLAVLVALFVLSAWVVRAKFRWE